MEEKEISFIDQNISSLLVVPLHPSVTSLTLHCNNIPRIEGLNSAWLLRHLDLSSNCISKIEGLSTLTSLRTLNLSCNTIKKVEGLNGLVRLTRLDLSFNQINDLTGLLHLHGPGSKLKYLSLYSNHLGSIDHLLQCLLGLRALGEVLLSRDGKDNPLCRAPGYREIVMRSLPQVSFLDGLDRLGNPSHSQADSLFDIPGLENYVDLLCSDASHSDVDALLTTPGINKVLASFQQSVAPEAALPKEKHAQQVRFFDAEQALNEERVKKLEQQVSRLILQASARHNSGPPREKVPKAKKDTDRTSESECDSGKENFGRTAIPKYRKSASRRFDSDQENPKQKISKSAVRPRRCSSTTKGGTDASRPAGSVSLSAPSNEKSKFNEEETYRAIVEERDQERERRWKAEQAVTKLTEDLKCLKTKVSEEKDLQSMAMHTTDRLKDVLLKEQSGRCELQMRVEELQGRCRSLTQKLQQARGAEEQQKQSILKLKENISAGEAHRARQQAEEMKRHQELENKVSALKRELHIQRASVCQHTDKVQQLQELLANREQEHRKQLEMRLQPGGVEFLAAVAQEVASQVQKHSRRESELKETAEESKKAYAALEDEFRMALTIEASRFSEVKKACDKMTAQLSELRMTLADSQLTEKKSASMVQDLTAIVKEQKRRISDLIKEKREAATERKRVQALEAELDQDRRLGLQLEMLKKEKAGLSSQLTAQESVIDGLRAERKLWGQELAQQGASLAQDRGRLESRVEVLGAELEAQKKQNDKSDDSLRIKSKIIEDQTQTIRKLKETLQERDELVRRLRDEKAEAQKTFQQQLEEETSQMSDLIERVEHLSLRKEELKQQLVDKEEEMKHIYRQEKAQMLTQLESKVKGMKDNFHSKERSLVEERDNATEAHRAAMEKLHCMDEALHLQLESVRAAHQAELLQLANDKHRQIELANQKVYEVEEEMRQLLLENENDKRTMEKVNRLTSAGVGNPRLRSRMRLFDQSDAAQLHPCRPSRFSQETYGSQCLS
ncbi:leucine-rich repeat and coiled-coil domain-containing protein 1 isoform X2 [Entelurus aequoreus]|uniref:leucine-rich repeat and coiled-coil domain-containing protein 1 isoform X2 n=1 Tax=Entelurus aequoreus TaxID=161455 RepID=UPI002B1E2C47|nr:leucine-rich repeat and coiled-coil domain-containing protein 1 isoform X2 [Entelurus aequoreus]